MGSISRRLSWLSVLSMCSAYLIHFLGYAQNDAIFHSPENTGSWSIVHLWARQQEPQALQLLPFYPRKVLEYYIKFTGILFSITDSILDKSYVVCLIIWRTATIYGWIGLNEVKNLTISVGYKVINYIKSRYEESTKSPVTVFMENYNLSATHIIISLAFVVAVHLLVHFHVYIMRRYRVTFWQAVMAFVVVCMIVSIPWEFIRLYQLKVAEHAAVASLGVPAECVPESMSLRQSVRAWGVYQFSWNSRPCEEYYQALLVDPIWEITPMMVLTSVLIRCVLHPVQMTSEAAGVSIKLLFSHIPLPWQPGVMVMGSVAGLLLLVTCFRYRLYLPFWFRLEPGDGDCKKCKYDQAKPIEVKPRDGDGKKFKQDKAKPVRAKHKQLEFGEGDLRRNKPHVKRGEEKEFEFVGGDLRRNKPYLKRGEEAAKEKPRHLKFEDNKFKQKKLKNPCGEGPEPLDFGDKDDVRIEHIKGNANRWKNNRFSRRTPGNYQDRELQPNGACKIDANRGKLDVIKVPRELHDQAPSLYGSCVSPVSTYNADDMLDASTNEDLLPPTAEGLSLYERMNVSSYGYGE